jgi:hypothetical protein
VRAHEANAGSGHQRAGSNSDSNAATHRASAASQTDLRYSISVALVDVATDREVWMLYSSFLRALGPGLIWAYGPQAQAIAVGTPGGGPDIPGSPQMPVLS